MTSNDLYLAGPMRGYDQFNFPAFDAAAEVLRRLGYVVFSPAERDRAIGFDETRNSLDGFDLYAALRADFDFIVHHANGIALLPGWEKSSGAKLERQVAEAIGLPVYYYRDDIGLIVATCPILGDAAILSSETILEEAQRLVYGARQKSYGHPFDDFTRTGRIWGAILGIPDVSPALVGLCMAGVKMSREVNAPKRDNMTDMAGYAGTVALVREREGEGAKDQ